MALNWDDLKVALAIGRAGSITRAADILQIDQSTAGRRLAALEAGLGTVLFVRSKKGLVPNAAGEAAIARATEIELRLDRLSEQLNTGPDGPAGTVRMLGNAWIIDLLAQKRLAPFLEQHPGIDLRTFSLTPRLPARGDATVSLWFEAPPREMEFAIKLGAIPYAVYAARGTDPDSLDWVSFLDEDVPRLAPTRALDKLRRRGDRLRLTATDARILVTATVAGAGKGLLPMCLAREEEALVRVKPGPPEMSRTLNLHLHPDTVQTVRVQAVIRWLRESFEPVFVPPDVAADSDL